MRNKGVLTLLFLGILLLSMSPSVLAQRDNQTIVFFFWGDGCPHCQNVKDSGVLEKVSNLDNVKVYELEIYLNQSNQDRFSEFAAKLGISAVEQNVPFLIIECNEKTSYLLGDGPIISNLGNKDYLDKIVNCDLPPNGENQSKITLPLFGEIDSASLSLPVFTLVIAGLDSFNPCAFFVLFFLLSLLIHAKSRKKMLIIGGVFVFFSGLLYFLFMAAWLNFFLIVGQLRAITLIAGLISIVISAINIKEYFWFKSGVSLTIPDSAKPKLFERMRNLVKEGRFASMIVSTAILAIAANTYELLCTAGFPMVYTRVLTLNNLTHLEYYAYLAMYNIVYVIPLAAIVLFFTLTLGSRKLKEDEGRTLKLLSGIMMLCLGAILVVIPSMLNNVFVAAGILLFSVITTVAVRTGFKSEKQ